MKTGLIGFPILFTCWLVYEAALPACSGDFSQVQQTYIPSSLIPRRFDLDPVGETNWASSNSANSSLAAGASTQSIIEAINSAQTKAQLSAAGNRGKKALAKLIDKGRSDDAEELARKLVQADPKDQESRDKLTQILVSEARRAYNKPDLEIALRKAREALSFEPTCEPAKLLLKDCFTKLGLSFQSAKEHLQVADALAAQGKFVEGKVEYRLALQTKSSAAAHIGLGNIAVSQGLFDEASKEYQTALRIDPKSGAAYRQLGCLKFAFRDYPGANQDLSTAVALNARDESAKKSLIELWQQQVAASPNAVNGHLGLARSYFLCGNLASAKIEYRQVAKMDPNNPHLPAARMAFRLVLAKNEAQKCLEAARTLMAEGALCDAQAKLNEALKYTPGSPEVLLLYGEVFQKLGLKDQAHDAYMAVLKADPKNTIAAKRLTALAAPPASGKSSSSTVLPLVTPLRAKATSETNTLTAAGVPVSANPALVSKDQAPPLAPPIGSNSQRPAPPLYSNANPAAKPSAIPVVAPALSPDSIPFAPSSTPNADEDAHLPSNQSDNNQAPGSSTISSLDPSGTAASDNILPATVPGGVQSISNISKLGGFLGSVRNLTLGNRQPSVQDQPQSPDAAQSQFPYGVPTKSPYGAQFQSPYGFQSQSPYGYATPGYTMTVPPTPSPPPSQSLLSAMAAPITNKLGLPALGSGNSQSNPVVMTNVTVPQYVANPSGGFYMVPTSVPVVVTPAPSAQSGQSNPLWSQLANSKVGQKFHMAQVTQDASGIGSLLNKAPVPAFLQQQQQQNQVQINNLVAANAALTGSQAVALQVLNPRADQISQSAPQIQINDWNTANSEPDEIGPVPGSIKPGADQSSSEAEREVGLKPDILAVSLAESLNRPVSLKISEVKETANGARVTVILENNGTKELKIPNNQKIALRLKSKAEQFLAIKFKTHTVPAGGTVTGIVAVPVHQLDSSSDLYLPKFLQDGVKLTDLHAKATI